MPKKRIDRAERVARKLITLEKIVGGFNLSSFGWCRKICTSKAIAVRVQAMMQDDLASALRKAGVR